LYRPYPNDESATLFTSLIILFARDSRDGVWARPPASGLLQGLPGNNVTVNIKFDVTVNSIDLLVKYMHRNSLKSLVNKFYIHFDKKFTFLLKF
jgi:hypothetical protein